MNGKTRKVVRLWQEVVRTERELLVVASRDYGYPDSKLNDQARLEYSQPLFERLMTLQRELIRAESESSE